MSVTNVQVIKPGWLIDGLGGPPVTGAMVVVVGGRISWAGALAGQGEPPGLAEARANGQVLDVPHATLLPGLIDCHTHTNMPGDGRTGEAVDQESDDLRLLRSAKNVVQAREAGVTTMADCGSWNGTAFSLKEGISLGVVDGPRVLVSGPPLTITGGHLWYMGGEADGVDGVREQVRRLISHGADIIKVMASGGSTLTSYPYRPAFDVEEVRAITEEAHKLGKPVAAHCRSTVSINNALDCGVDLIFHGFFADADGSYRFDQPTAERVAASGVWVNPTYYLGRPQRVQLRRKQQRECLTVEEVESLARSEEFQSTAKEQFGRLVEMGVKLASGSDAGWSWLRFGDFQGEIMSMTELGLSPMEAILTGTRNTAEALGILATVGTIEPGKVADLLLVEGNPVEDKSALRRVVAVFQSGRRMESQPAVAQDVDT